MNLPGNFFVKPDTEPKTSVSTAGNHKAYIFFNEKTGKYRIHINDRFEAFKHRNLSTQQTLPQCTNKKMSLFYFSAGIGEAIRITDHDNNSVVLNG